MKAIQKGRPIRLDYMHGPKVEQLETVRTNHGSAIERAPVDRPHPETEFVHLAHGFMRRRLIHG